MLIVCFGQGLGNQMFQYAFMIALEQAYPNNSILMDIDNIIEADHNGFELDRVFDISVKKCSRFQAVALANTYPKSMPMGLILNGLYKIRRIWNGNKDSCIEPDDSFRYYKELFGLNPLKSYIFIGRWINEYYFKSIEKEVRERFVFSNPLDSINAQIVKEMHECESVSVHVRRGDYLNLSCFYILNLDYYKKASEIIEKAVYNPCYYIFSDDKEYIKNNFSFLKRYVIIDWNVGESSYKDMQLMSECKHNIIANSTFSFWGAWLNRNPNKIVVAPNKLNRNHATGCTCSSWNIIDIERC